MDPTPFQWHAATATECLNRLGADPDDGLDAAEAARRLERHGPNEIPSGAQRGPLLILAGQFRDFIMWVLAGAAVVSGLVGELADTIVILAIIVLNAVIGFVQEYRAERAIAALRQLAAPVARVRRGGAVAAVPAAALVPGDVVELEAGDIVPADLRLLQGAQLRADESALTGESQPVDKAAGATVAAAAPVGDRINMAWKGTLAVHGRASGVVVATGLGTELGRIATLLASAEDLRTPLQRRLGRFGRQLSLAVLAVCAIMFVAGLQRGPCPWRSRPFPRPCPRWSR
jgi:Ca2+-transporting ATPase